MTQNLLHKPHLQMKAQNRNQRQTPAQLRADAESMLRDIAFVLKMTERVRDEMETQQEAQDAAMV